MNQKGSLLLYLALIITFVSIMGSIYGFTLYQRFQADEKLNNQKQQIIEEIKTSTSSGITSLTDQELLSLALENTDKASSLYIDVQSHQDIKADNRVWLQVKSSGYTMTDRLNAAEKNHLAFENVGLPNNFPNTIDTIIFYKNNIVFEKDPLSQNKWLKLTIKKDSPMKNPYLLTSTLSKQLYPETLTKESANNSSTVILKAKVDPKKYYSKEELYIEKPELYSKSNIEVEVFVDTINNRVSKLIYHTQNQPYRAGIPSGELIDSTNILTYSKYNDPVTIDPPITDLITMEELEKIDPVAVSYFEKEVKKYSSAY